MDTVSFQMDPNKRQSLHSLAAEQGRTPDAVLNDALDAYLDLWRWQANHIAKGLREADAGRFVSEEEVAATFKRLKE